MSTPRSPIARAAEARFARYMDERGYSYEYEPDLGIPERPEYKVVASGLVLAAEVKAFETYGIFNDLAIGQVRTRSLAEALKPVRRQIKDAAGQLRSLRDRGWPLVVVLDNPAGRPIPLEPTMVIAAMYGDLSLQAPVEDDGTVGDFRSALGRNGKLTVDHAYISAVAVVRQRDHGAAWFAQWYDEHRDEYGRDAAGQRAMIAAVTEAAAHDAPTGDDLYLEVFETVSDTAARLPRDVFNGPLDIRWVPTPGRDGLMPLAATDL